MKIVLVGPTHPYKGGIAQHTTRLAHELTAAGHTVYIESWHRQYPALLYPGVLTVPEGRPEMPVYSRTLRRLSWNRPDSWLAAGRRMAGADLVVLVVASTVQILPYLSMLPALGRTRTVALMHNVLPHEAKPWDRALVASFVSRVDGVLVHSVEQHAMAAQLAPGSQIAMTPLPAILRGAAVQAPPRRARVEEPLEVLAFGLVRPYKGVDLLIEAAARVPQARVTVAGEFWIPPDDLARLAHAHGVADRVVLRPGYVAAEDVPRLFAAAHLVALTYRSVTGSGNVKLAFEHARPVIATAVGALAAEVGERYGVLAAPEAADIARALNEVCEPAVYNRLAQNVGTYPRGAPEREWTEYVSVIGRLAGP